MQRDIDLIRLLLLQVESGEKPDGLDSYTEPQILYHCDLAIQAGLIDGSVVHDHTGQARRARLQKLTWEGHEFLDAARSQTVWNQAKTTVKKTGGSWTLETLKVVLLEIIRRAIT